MTVDTNPITSLVQAEVNVLGQQVTGDIEVTAVEPQLYEVTVNGGVPLSVEIPTEVTTAVEQATAAVSGLSQQVSETIPPAHAVEAAWHTGAVAAAWYEVTTEEG